MATFVYVRRRNEGDTIITGRAMDRIGAFKQIQEIIPEQLHLAWFTMTYQKKIAPVVEELYRANFVAAPKTKITYVFL